jgi:hypothetical protein
MRVLPARWQFLHPLGIGDMSPGFAKPGFDDDVLIKNIQLVGNSVGRALITDVPAVQLRHARMIYAAILDFHELNSSRCIPLFVHILL